MRADPSARLPAPPRSPLAHDSGLGFEFPDDLEDPLRATVHRRNEVTRTRKTRGTRSIAEGRDRIETHG